MSKYSHEFEKILVKDTLRHIGMILTGDIWDPITILGVYLTFDELSRPAQDFIIDNIHVPKDKFKYTSMKELSQMQDVLKSRQH